nr:hypothetical protein [uncultured Rhodopila sp.]
MSEATSKCNLTHGDNDVWFASSELRFVEHAVGTGHYRRILQQKWLKNYGEDHEWRDVPLVKLDG